MTNTNTARHAAPYTALAEVTSNHGDTPRHADDDGVRDMPASLVREGDRYVTGSGRTVEVCEVIRGAGSVRIRLADGWLFWRAGSDLVRILRAA